MNSQVHKFKMTSPTSAFIFATILTIFATTFAADDEFSPQSVSNSYGDTADNASKITFSDLPKGKSYKTTDSYSQGVLAPLYKMADGFVNTVQPSEPDFIKGMIKALAEGDFGYITNDVMGTLKNFAGIMACVVIGIIFVGFMPLVGLCFCCCRCCGKCGGSRRKSFKFLENANCLCCAYSIIVLILFAFLLTGSLLVYKSSDAMMASVSSIAVTFKTNLDDVETFLENTVDEIDHITSVHFNFTADVINRDLDNIGYLVGVPIRNEFLTSAGVQDVVDAVKSLDTKLQVTGAAMLEVNASIAYLSSNATALSNALSTAKTNLDNALKESNCSMACSSFDTSSIAMDFDPDDLPDISSEMDLINDVMKINLTARAQQGYIEIDAVPTRVKNETNSTVHNVKNLLEDFKGTIQKTSKNIRDLPKEVSSSTSEIKGQINAVDETMNKFDLYRQIFGIVLASIVLLIAVLQCLGLSAGVFSYRKDKSPTERSCLANSAADCLMASTGFVFIFSWLLMTFTTVTFLLGAPMKKFLCGALTDPDMTLISELVDTPGQLFDDYILGRMILNNGSIPLTVTGVLKGCKADKAAMVALKLDSLFDVDEVTNYRKSIDIDKELDALDIDLSDIEVLSADTENKLVDFRNALGLDFAGFRNEFQQKISQLDKNTTQANLTTLADAVKALGDNSTDPAQTALYNSVTEIQNIESNEYSATVAAQARLLDSINKLENATTPLPAAINNTIDKAKAVDNYLNTTGASFIKAEAKRFANRVLGSADQFVNNTLDLMYKDVGQCRPVWNVWNSLTNVLFCQKIVDSLGGFWFSLGWSCFFMALSAIFNVKLAKYFRKMKSVDGDKDPLISTSNSSLHMNPMQKRNKVAPINK